jgi:DNA-damage-inducible protein J
MAATAMVHVCVDENIKAQAAETLAAMGLSVSDAVRVFLTRIANCLSLCGFRIRRHWQP